MKKIRQSVNLLLSAIIVALGFGSCVSQKTYNAAQEEIKQLKGENDALKAENASLRHDINKIREYQQRAEERKVVYGPRPTGYNDKIGK